MSAALKLAPSVRPSPATKPAFPSLSVVGSAGNNPAARFSDDLLALHSASVRRRFSRGETILSEGEAANHCYKLVSGTVRLCAYMPDGRCQVVAFLLPGDLFGLTEFPEYAFTAEAIDDVVAVSYPRAQVWRIEQEAGTRRNLMNFLFEGLRALRDHMMVLGCQTAKERVGSFLLRLSERTATQEGKPLELSMGRQDIANHLGLTIETVCRSIGELKREGIIAVPNRHQIVVNKIAALQTLAHGTEH